MGNWSENLRDSETGKPVQCPEPSPELQLAIDCKEWGVLPKAGGLLDQPVGLLEKMRVAYRAFESLRLWRDRKPGKEGKFKEQHPDAFIMVEYVDKLREERKNGRH